MESSEFPALFHLFGCYFHQDFFLDFGTWEDALSQFLKDEPKDSIDATVKELRDLLARNMDEQELSRTIGFLACYYYPPGDGLTTLGWLRLLEQKLGEFLLRR
jgi:CdiI immunity protein